MHRLSHPPRTDANKTMRCLASIWRSYNFKNRILKTLRFSQENAQNKIRPAISFRALREGDGQNWYCPRSKATFCRVLWYVKTVCAMCLPCFCCDLARCFYNELKRAPCFFLTYRNKIKLTNVSNNPLCIRSRISRVRARFLHKIFFHYVLSKFLCLFWTNKCTVYASLYSLYILCVD